jgi:hypothetical protein
MMVAEKASTVVVVSMGTMVMEVERSIQRTVLLVFW